MHIEKAQKVRPFLAGGVPDLSLDEFAIDGDAAGGEFDADGGFGFQAELVSRESGQEVGLSNGRITDKDELEQVVIVFVGTH